MSRSIPIPLQAVSLEQRPRERLAREGTAPLSNEELLAIMFGRGQRGKDVLTLAHEVADYLASLSDVPTLAELCLIPGIGPGKACQILASLELSQRFLTRRRKVHIHRSADALPLLGNLRMRRQECFVVLTLDGAHQVIKVHEITVGLANQSQVHPRETFACALEDRAVGILVAHNHPSVRLALLLHAKITLKTRKPQALDFEPRTLGKHILHARLKKKLLQKDVARQIGVRVQTLGSWENDRRHPLISQMPAILTFIGYDPNLPEETTFTLQDRMREKRRVMGWSVSDAARHYGVFDHTWTRWENGVTNHPPVESIEQFLRGQNLKEPTP